MANKHFTTNRVLTENEDYDRLRRMMQRVEDAANAELLRRVQSIKANLDRKAGR